MKATLNDETVERRRVEQMKRIASGLSANGLSSTSGDGFEKRIANVVSTDRKCLKTRDEKRLRAVVSVATPV